MGKGKREKLIFNGFPHFVGYHHVMPPKPAAKNKRRSTGKKPTG
jgi:hypothetical protein